MIVDKNMNLTDLKKALAAHAPRALFVDVRSAEECYAAFVPGFVNIPVADIGRYEYALSRYDRIVLLCASGMRARQAAHALEQRGLNQEIWVLQGGLNAIARGAEQALSRAGRIIPVMRQMQIGAGSIILGASAMGVFVSPLAFAVVAGVGCGLLYAGATGKCGLSNVLAYMPWNKNLPQRAKAFVEREMAVPQNGR